MKGEMYMSKHEKKRTSNPLRRSAVISFLTGLLCLLGVSAIGALLILKGWLPEQSRAVLAVVAVLLASWLGPIPMMKANGKKRLPIAYTNAGLLLLALLLMKWIAWPKEPFGNWMVVAAAFLGATLSGVLLSRKPRRR